MAIPSEVVGHLLLTADQLIRHAGGPDNIDALTIGRYLYDHARPETRGTRQEYTRIGSDAIRMARLASRIRDNPNDRIRNVPELESISMTEPAFAYRVVVVGRNIDNEEVFSTAVWIRSDNPLTANELKQLAIGQVTPVSANYTEKLHGRQIHHYDAYVMLAGQKVRNL